MEFTPNESDTPAVESHSTFPVGVDRNRFSTRPLANHVTTLEHDQELLVLDKDEFVRTIGGYG
jgi:hypothetical protein